MARILVTGASGYLGSEVAARAAAAGWEVFGTWLTRAPRGVAGAPLDVREAAAVSAVVAEVAPAAIVHTAYRQDGEDAERVTVAGSAAVAQAARETGARLVHLSSDVVFRGGPGGRPLREEDPVDPVSAYGAAKAEAEQAVAAADPAAVLVRTSLIYGGPGHAPSGHETLALEAARGRRPGVRFFTNELRSPVQVGDLAAAVLELATLDVAGPLHVAGADVVDRLAFAALVVRAAGLDPAALVPGRSGPDRPGAIALDSSRARALLRTRLRGVGEVLAR
jgi:dTDP-4-dehydrorhamnose reductase